MPDTGAVEIPLWGLGIGLEKGTGKSAGNGLFCHAPRPPAHVFEPGMMVIFTRGRALCPLRRRTGNATVGGRSRCHETDIQVARLDIRKK